MGLLTPAFCCLRHARDGVIIEVLRVNDALHLLAPIGDPVAVVVGQEERDEHVNRAGVGGVLDEGGHESVVVTSPESYTTCNPTRGIQTLR